MAELRVRTPDGAERTVALTSPATVGRADDCTVVVAEQKASRRHCRFEPFAGGWRVVDEGSSNGTWLLGRPVLNARLRSGDELEIGDTVLTFLDGPPSPTASAPAAPRRPRTRRRPTPWGLLAIPVLAGAGAFALVRALGDASRQETETSFAEYADAEIARAALRQSPSLRVGALRAARDAITRRIGADRAVAALDAAIEKESGASADVREPREGDGAEWREPLGALDVDTSLSPMQRRAAVVTLLERHFAEPAAVAALRDRLRVELSSAGERARTDRERAFEEGDRAAEEGRFGDALAAWKRWIASVPAVPEEYDRPLAVRFADAIERSRAAAEQTAAQYEAARREGRAAEAERLLAEGASRLVGTGYDVWLLARSATQRLVRAPGASETADDVATRERARALQLSSAAEQIARTRRFDEAAARMDEAAAAVSDPAMKADIAARAGDLRAEQAYLGKLLALAAADPAKFSPVKVGEKSLRVVSASPEGVSLAYGNAAPEDYTVADLPSAVLAQFVEKLAPAGEDQVSAALLLHDLGEEEGYQKWMRAALSVEDVRLANSLVHARVIGVESPPDGFMPHPRDGRSIVTRREHDRVLNEEKIAALTADLAKEVEKLEKSRQAKAIDSVRKAYAKLEKARADARALIFDEVRYFYPYRTRMPEYAPVQQEVNDLVKAVEEAWADGTKATVRSDSAYDALLKKCRALLVDIAYLGGDEPAELAKRIEAIVLYVPETGSTSPARELTVQSFYESEADLALLEYNAKVMKHNPSVKGPTEPERKQVEVTNQYRIMFGHLRALRIHPMLVAAARGHSEDMSKLGFFDHTNPHDEKKRNPDDRVKLAGYPMAGCSENIQQGTGDPKGAHDGWCRSSGHHRNILTPAWVEMGSGVSGGFFTQNFGFRLDDEWEDVPK